MKVRKIETKYILENEDYLIYASVSEDGNITLENDSEERDFYFVNSDREIVKSMGELLIAASKIK